MQPQWQQDQRRRELEHWERHKEYAWEQEQKRQRATQVARLASMPPTKARAAQISLAGFQPPVIPIVYAVEPNTHPGQAAIACLACGLLTVALGMFAGYQLHSVLIAAAAWIFGLYITVSVTRQAWRA